MQGWLRRLTVSSTLAVLTAGPVHAGTYLKLNSGAVDPEQIFKTYSSYQDGAVANYIVQFHRVITAGDRAALEKQFEVLGYLPDDALIVRGVYSDIALYRVSHPAVRAVVKYQSQYKINNDIGVLSVFDKEKAQSIMINTFKESDSEKVQSTLVKLKAELQAANGKVLIAAVSRDLIPVLAEMTEVEHIQATPELQTFDFYMDQDVRGTETMGTGDYSDIVGDETGTKSMKFDSVWAAGFTGKNQTASMADTGLDTGDMNSIAPDFQGAVHSGYFFGLFSKSWEDPMGHGTHVAGSIVGRGTKSDGRIKGGAYDAQFVAESMWSPMLNGLSVPSKLSDLFGKASADGARVHSNSWGAARSFGAYDSMAVQVDEWMFNNPDTLVLFAAGNSGADKDKDGRIDPGTMTTPGTAKNCLTVGASKNNTKTGGIQVPISKLKAAKDEWSAEPIYSSYLSDRDDGIAMFSSRGPTLDGRTKPDVVAPGTNILSTRSHVKNASPLWGAYNDDYAWSGGTSMATPLTAGAVTVARQVLVEKWNIQNPSAALMKAMLMHSADDLYPGQFGEVGASKGQELLTRRPNSDEGYGRVDVTNMIALADSTKVIDSRDGISQGQEVTYNFNLTKPGHLSANLVWTDFPGSANAAKALVNDLDLVLTTPDGQTISMNDHINNHELIEKSGLPAGSYKLSVKGFNVPQGKSGAQPFALIYTVSED